MNKIYLQRIGANIKRYRLEKNLKQEYIDRKVGLHKSEISRIENGQINVSVITLFKIAEAIEINVALLFN